MNKLLKKIVSGITTVSLGMAMVGSMPAVADETAVASTVTRTLSVDFMGRGSSPQELSPGSARLTADDIGKEFWVGVAVDNVSDLPLFTDGIYSLELAFEYNPDFVTPYFTSNAAEAEWAAALESGNLAAVNNSTWWNSEQYEIISVAETDIDTVTDRENADVMAQRKADGWKMCTVCVTLKSGASFAGARFKDLADSEKQYLLKLPFKLNSVPAGDAVDTNPRVLSLVRGPETLDIGSGETGTEPYSAWEATVTDPDDATNMKTLFEFSGDISLFDSGGSVEDIVPVEIETDEETGDTTETMHTLSTTKDLTLDGFKAETLDYYLSVPNETEKLKFKITSSELPAVTANTASVAATLTSTDKLYETDEFDLAELDKTVEADGYNNTVTVTAGDTTYTLHIRRLLKPKIVLNYGNSPYGEIMRADNIAEEDKQAAKEAFNAADKFTTQYCPTNCSTSMIYKTNAWNGETDSNLNMDRNDYAIFAYEKTPFKDAGFSAYDSMGDSVDAEDITRSMDFYYLTSNNLSEDLTGKTPNNISITNVESEYTFTTITISTKYVRPDIYEMEYSFRDAYTGEKVTKVRNIVILLKNGDTNVDNSVNGTDLSPIVNYVKGIPLISSDTTIVPLTTQNIFKYRSVDVNMDASINGTDLSPIVNHVKGIYLGQFYNEIK